MLSEPDNISESQNARTTGTQAGKDAASDPFWHYTERWNAGTHIARTCHR